MPQLSDIHARVQSHKRRRKELTTMYKDALTQNEGYQHVKDELEKLIHKKKQLEAAVKADFTHELNELDQIKEHLKSDTALMSDVALTHISQGKEATFTDENNTTFEPVINVRFKKTDRGAQQNDSSS